MRFNIITYNSDVNNTVVDEKVTDYRDALKKKVESINKSDKSDKKLGQAIKEADKFFEEYGNDDSIKSIGKHLMENSFFSPAVFDSLYNFIAFHPQSIHFRDYFRRMLQITIHNNTSISACQLKPRKNAGFLSKISAKLCTFYSWIFCTFFKNCLICAIL